MELTINNVAFMEYDKVPYTLSNIIAEGVGIKHSSITRTIRKHEKDFEEFGKLGFKIRPSDSGQNEKIYILNEEQATLLITYLKNTDIVREFKKRLVKEFYKLKEEVINFRIQREIEKPLRRTLTDAISTWEHGNKWSYKASQTCYTNVLQACVLVN
ncbi:Rha family transcriptional regulator [Peptostreptococcus porci]|uniref:Rha family transcriptional regulator n=1 Tax=Peptostreptococcus porci TaxID=2652282 RepID=UPI002A91E66C|nr:Rha family transcriptional regulator [Peptostreptococcus porci]MDY5435804.1 Rha family transcriptional regulator [Peptostreptococcus porci]